MTTHVLKTWPEYFQDVLELRKTFEVRENDRDYKVGDVLEMREFDPDILDADNPTLEGSYSGRVLRRRVTYVLQGGCFGIHRGYCVLGII